MTQPSPPSHLPGILPSAVSKGLKSPAGNSIEEDLEVLIQNMDGGGLWVGHNMHLCMQGPSQWQEAGPEFKSCMKLVRTFWNAASRSKREAPVKGLAQLGQ